MKSKILAILLSMLMIFTFSSDAEEVFEISAVYDAGEDEIIINGKGEGEIIVTVMKFAVNESSLSPSNLPTDMFQISSGGEYSCSISMPSGAGGGKYKVCATANGKRAEDSFIYINYDEACSVLDSITGKESRAEFISKVKKDAEKIGIDTTDIHYTDNADEILGLLYDMGNDKGEPDEFYNEYYKAFALTLLNGLNAESESFTSDAEEILSDYGVYLGIDFDKDYKDDKRLSADAKAELLEILCGENFGTALADKKVFSNYFTEIKALSSVKCAKVWQDIKNVILTDFEDIFGDMVSGDKYYHRVKTVQNVYSKMMKDTFSRFDDIAVSFENAAKSVYKKENADTSSSSSTGGSSSGGGAITTPANPQNPLWTPSENSGEDNIQAETSEMRDMPALNGSAAISFKDLDKSHWSYKAVSAMAEAGIISGYEDGNFKPSGFITRAEFTKMIYSAFGIGDGIESFSDVKSDAWFYKAVSSAAANGIIKGSGGAFRPNDKITRQDAALIIYRAIHYRGMEISGNATFEDNADIDRYAFPAVGALKSYQIAVGADGNYFLPKNTLTRAEAAQLIYNAVNVVHAAQDKEV